MSFRRVVPLRIARPPPPPRDDDGDDAEEEESESGTDSVYDSYSSDADLEPEPALELAEEDGDEEGEESEEEEGDEEEEEEEEEDDDIEEEEEEGEEEEEEEEEEGASEEGVKNEEEKVKENATVGSGDNVVLPNCPVCMEAWTSEGPHRVCCIPCGHVYGRLCLEEWLRKCRNKGKCPQCNRKFNLKQITNLFAPKILVPNDDLEKEVTSLREKIELLTLERVGLREEINKQRHDHAVILRDMSVILRDVQQRTMHDAALLNEFSVQMSQWGTHIKAMEKQVCHWRFSGEYGYYPGSSSGSSDQ